MESLQYANAAQRSELESAGIHLFYLLANLINSDVKDNSPAIQFFSSNTEVLGKVSGKYAQLCVIKSCHIASKNTFLLNMFLDEKLRLVEIFFLHFSSPKR